MTLNQVSLINYGEHMSDSCVFFFGAGASKAEGGLLASEILFEALRSSDLEGEYTSIVKAFLEDLFRIDDATRIISVEEIPGFEEL